MNGYQIGAVIVALGVLLLCVAQLLSVIQGWKESKVHALKVKLQKAVDCMTWEQLKDFEKRCL